ncbi:hypothetical protein [Cognatiyoonia sp. IB215182]|nr:hypothetical protein [Cognatiyoonia sp. IB215182]MDX8355240.1 hypothetical protein [Cognatiyoonia sp. IB215182]
MGQNDGNDAAWSTSENAHHQRYLTNWAADWCHPDPHIEATVLLADQ